MSSLIPSQNTQVLPLRIHYLYLGAKNVSRSKSPVSWSWILVFFFPWSPKETSIYSSSLNDEYDCRCTDTSFAVSGQPMSIWSLTVDVSESFLDFSLTSTSFLVLNCTNRILGSHLGFLVDLINHLSLSYPYQGGIRYVTLKPSISNCTRWSRGGTHDRVFRLIIFRGLWSVFMVKDFS